MTVQQAGILIGQVCCPAGRDPESSGVLSNWHVAERGGAKAESCWQGLQGGQSQAV